MNAPKPFNKEKVCLEFTDMMERIGKLKGNEQSMAFLFQTTEFLEKVWEDGKKYGEFIASLELRATKPN